MFFIDYFCRFWYCNSFPWSKTNFYKNHKTIFSKEKNQIKNFNKDQLAQSNRRTEKQNMIKFKKKTNGINIFHTINSTGEINTFIITTILYCHHF